MHDPAAGVRHGVVKGIDVGPVVSRKRDHLDMVHVGAVQAHDMMLVAAVRLEPGRAVL